MQFRLDRTAFSVRSHREEEKSKVFMDKSYRDRLEIAYYLNSIAYNFDSTDPPRIDKKIFSVRKRKS